MQVLIKETYRKQIQSDSGLLNKICQIADRKPNTILAWARGNHIGLTQKGVLIKLAEHFGVAESDLLDVEIE